MALLFGKLRGRAALAWLKHRRWWTWHETGIGTFDSRVTDDGTPRITADGALRVIRPAALDRRVDSAGGVRMTTDGNARLIEAA